MSSPSVCFVSHYAHAVFTGRPRDTRGVAAFGGAEVQQCVIARALAARGVDVRFVSYAEGPPREEERDGVRFFTVPVRTGAGILQSARTNLDFWRAMRRADATIYYQRCAGSLTGLVGLFSRLHGRVFVFAVANDRDIDGRFLESANKFQAMLYRLGVRLARAVVVQSRKQEKLLRGRWGRESTAIPSACALDLDEAEPAPDGSAVLWVGNLLSKKRPDLLLDLAESLPEIPFTMIAVPLGEPVFVRAMLDRIRNAPNVDYVEGVSYGEMPAHYRRAALLVSTSVAEGFPNVFMEAWAHGLPVVSLDIDPDELICERNLGFHARSMEEMKQGVLKLLGDPGRRKRIGERAQSYVREFHSPAHVAARYDLFLRSLLEKPG